MTDTEQDLELMRMIKEHRDNEQKIVCLTSKLERIANAIPTFLKKVDSEMERGQLLFIEEKVSDIAKEYEEAIKKRESFKRNLKNAGFGVLFNGDIQ